MGPRAVRPWPRPQPGTSSPQLAASPHQPLPSLRTTHCAPPTAHHPLRTTQCTFNPCTRPWASAPPAPAQNLGEAEYLVSLYQYMRLLGYPAAKISILTTYNGQKALIRDVIERRCAGHPAFGRPAKVRARGRGGGCRGAVAGAVGSLPYLCMCRCRLCCSGAACVAGVAVRHAASSSLPELWLPFAWHTHSPCLRCPKQRARRHLAGTRLQPPAALVLLRPPSPSDLPRFFPHDCPSLLAIILERTHIAQTHTPNPSLQSTHPPTCPPTPAQVTTVDKYQGQQNDYVLLSLVRTRAFGHLRDVRRLVSAGQG